MKKILFFTFLLIWQIGFSANESDKLQKINQQIKSVKENLTHKQAEKKTLNDKLKNLEVSIGNVARKLDDNSQQLKTQVKKLDQLKTQESAIKIKIEEQQTQLQKQIETAYVLSRQPKLKVLLSQQNPDSISRMMKYNEYINFARVRYIKSINSSLQELVETEKQVGEQTRMIKTLVENQAREKQSLQHNFNKRKIVLTELNQQINSQQSRLKQLIDNKRELESLVSKLREQAKKQTFTSFAKMKGKLPWPTEGKVVQGFGTSIDGNRLRSTGVTISAPIGRDVRAIAPGRVVFANWLKGYGLLLIVEHSDGFMTLYGHNYSLYKTKGQTVKTGDLIAKVGKSGGFSKSSLYFEIRHAGQPVNPARWCAGKP